MQNTKFNIMNPYIEIKPYPINAAIDDLEDSNVIPLFHVLISQGHLKMIFLVAMQDPKITGRTYQVVRCENIFLHGINERDEYLGQVGNPTISADSTIVNEVFEWSLKPYGLKILEATFHNFEFFESEIEGKGYIFENYNIYEKLKDIINTKCIKMMKNPKLNQF